MKGLGICLALVAMSTCVRNTPGPFPVLNRQSKVFVITLDGFRWQEVFQGADQALLEDRQVTVNAPLVKALYGQGPAAERRKKLLPFFWNVIAAQGQLYGNRLFHNMVNTANPYALSYPGYSELLTGRVDLSIMGNARKRNPNPNILDALNRSKEYAGKVAAFTSWDVFPFILNKKPGSVYLNSGWQNISGPLSYSEKLLNTLQTQVRDEKKETRYDELTFIACREYLLKNTPSVVFLSFSGTDDAGHARRYDEYLQKANNADRMIGELWSLVQSLPEYAGHTTFIITTDHGRGSHPANWHKHGFLIDGSTHTWFALFGSGIVPTGEMKNKNQLYQKELNNLVLQLLAKR